MAVRVGPVSAAVRPRAVVVPLLLAGVALLLAAVDVGRGDYPIGVIDVLRILAGAGEQTDRFVVVELRLPRALAACLVGLALGAAGAILQSVARDPSWPARTSLASRRARASAPSHSSCWPGAVSAGPPPSSERRWPRCSAACWPPPPSTCLPGGRGSAATGWCSSASAVTGRSSARWCRTC